MKEIKKISVGQKPKKTTTPKKTELQKIVNKLRSGKF